MPSRRLTVAIIQARMGSTRLPGKVLREIAGQTMLERVVRRVQRCSQIDHVVVATSTAPGDDAIAAHCDGLGVPFTRGSEDDVLDRFYQAAIMHSAEICVRVCADSPLIDPGVCDLVVETLRDSDPAADYASNKLEPSYPLGLDVEAFTFEALDRAWHRAANPYERSHVTVNMYRSPGAYRLLAVRDETQRHSWRWTVDTTEDLKFVRRVVNKLGGDNTFTYADVVQLLGNEPELARINAHVRAKAVTEG